MLALLGENGAGKSTCVKLLAGVHRPDEGEVVLGGQPIHLQSPLDARRRGIAVMHQHPGLFPDLSVVENVFLGHMPLTGAGTIDGDRMRRHGREVLDAVGLRCDLDARLGQLRTSEQQLVEIARALSLDARVLIMDEPTAALSQREVDRLFGVVAELKARGVAMMFVGHRMEEIYRIADEIAVLRDGHVTAVEPARSLGRDRAVQLMIGRPLTSIYPRHTATPGAVALEVEGLSRQGAFADIAFSLRAGEIVGLGGLVGSGRTEIARVLFGIDRPDDGTIRVDGRPVTLRRPDDAMRAGIAYVSEDRLGQSLVMDFSILSNAVLPVLKRTSTGGIVRRLREIACVAPQLERMRLKFDHYDQPVKTLSGGNQQKVVLAKWLATAPRVLILDEPTQGIDVQSKAEVHAMIAELAERGMAILLISSELPELIGMCDRILVLREGRLTASFASGSVDQEQVIRAATDVESVSDRAGASTGAHEAAAPVSATASIFARRELGLVCAIAAVAIPAAFVNPHFLGAANITALTMDAALLMIAAAAQMLVMLTRNIDLSVASVIGLAAYGSASVMHAYPDTSVALGILTGCAIGLLCGAINGLVVTLGRVPSIVVTLGTLAVFRGFNSIWAGGRQISADQVPQAWLDLSGSRLAGIPTVIVIALVVLALLALLLSRHPKGRQLFAVGSNPEGAALVGIAAGRLVLGAFCLAGLLAGFDGALWASRYATIDARVAIGFELTVIATVVVGGVAVRGGSGSILGIMLGAVLLLVIQNALTLARVDPLWLQGVYGLVILAAVTVDAYAARRLGAAGRRIA
ncbi:hypothetical protein GCM10011390_26520 [Aureimonas endophytica]|uniref:ABC transporter domain-containing protein n=1 Tax=Aureimonas endophytica TaxID=2027858 RepID=A0A917E5W7_9HYPH|nr:hypothetical protein GCM10011390_26520 [Aureimonas endophytica]